MSANPKPTISFRALQIANEQRNSYGMRYNDFARYRKHCANRTHRLRATLKMTHGKGKEFKKLPSLTPDNVKDGHLQLLLFEAERAWAYAQELNTSALLPANKDHASSLRHSATGRFRRAVNWSTQLLSLCQALHATSRMSTENLLEITVYTVILNGRFLRYRDEFDDALIQLSVARSILDDLSSTASTSRDQALAILFSDEIGPEIRYCAHELGRAKAYDINAIVAELGPKYRNEIVEKCDALVGKVKTEESTSSLKAKLTERIWEGQPVPVRYPELVDVFLKVEKAETSLDRQQLTGKKSKLGVTSYDALLSALSDAEDVARKLQETHQPTASGTSGSRDIQFVHAYIVYQLLARRIQRDLLLMDTLLSSGGSAKGPGAKKSAQSGSSAVDSRLYPAVVKLLDTVLQSLTQMRALTVVDDSPDLASAVEARLAYANGFRCLYLARCYSAVNKHAEALALLQHATIHVREIVSNLSLSEVDPITEGTPPFFPLKAENIKEIEMEIAEDGLRYKRDWFAFNGGSNSVNPATYKKPLFFNIALNYVELDMDSLQRRAGQQPEAPVTPAKGAAEPQVEKKPLPKAKAEEQAAPAQSQEPQQQTAARGGISSLLGGWWSKSS